MGDELLEKDLEYEEEASSSKEDNDGFREESIVKETELTDEEAAGKTNEEATTTELNEEEDVEEKDPLTLLSEEVQQYKDMLQRERAEFQNYRRRITAEMAKTRQWSVANFATDFMGVLDNLDLVLGQKEGDLESFKEGVVLIRKEFISRLEQNKIEELNPEGEVYDPVSMEAMQMEDSSEVEEETVAVVFQKGFIMKSGDTVKVIRPARVKVLKPLIQAVDTNDEEVENSIDEKA